MLIIMIDWNCRQTASSAETSEDEVEPSSVCEESVLVIHTFITTQSSVQHVYGDLRDVNVLVIRLQVSQCVCVSAGVFSLTCDQHGSVVRRQQLESPRCVPDQMEAAAEEDQPTENWRYNKIERGPYEGPYEGPGPKSTIGAASKRPQQGEGVDSRSCSTEAGRAQHSDSVWAQRRSCSVSVTCKQVCCAPANRCFLL